MKHILALFVVAVVAGTAAAALTIKFTQSERGVVEQPIEPYAWQTAATTSASAPLAGSPVDFREAAAKTVDAVVHVKTTIEMQAPDSPWMEFFGYEGGSQMQQGSGSGVIVSHDGYIATNNHVIDGASTVEVTLNDNRSYTAQVIGVDPSTDLALLKIEGGGFPAVDFGNSDSVQVGEWVLAVGNPFDLTSTVTAGIVSAKGRNINLLRPDLDREIFPIESFIQTDAAVNPGNSGGALVNAQGKLIGINTAIASRTGSYAGYSFAVPSSIVHKVTQDLKEFGQVQRAFIGVRIGEVNEALAGELGLQEVKGAFVAGLTDNGAAEDAGIQAGDVILQVQDRDVSNVPELQEAVSKYRPGDKVRVGVWRDNAMKQVQVTLRNQDGDMTLHTAPLEQDLDVLLAAEFEAVGPEEAKELGIRGGAKVTALHEGKLAKSGVKRNFIITNIGDEQVRSEADVTRILKDKKGGVLLEGIYPNGQKAYYGFGM